MFCNLSRPVSTWICRIVLELYTVSLLARGCSFTTCHHPRCGQSRTAKWVPWSPTSPAAFWEASSARFNVTKCYVSLPNATLFCDKLSKAKTSVCDVFSSREAKLGAFHRSLPRRALRQKYRKGKLSSRCIFLFFFSAGYRAISSCQPALWL